MLTGVSATLSWEHFTEALVGFSSDNLFLALPSYRHSVGVISSVVWSDKRSRVYLQAKAEQLFPPTFKIGFVVG